MDTYNNDRRSGRRVAPKKRRKRFPLLKLIALVAVIVIALFAIQACGSKKAIEDNNQSLSATDNGTNSLPEINDGENNYNGSYESEKESGDKGNDNSSKDDGDTATKPTAKPAAGSSQTVADGDWNLLLVNATHSLPDNFSIDLTTIKGSDYKFDSRAYPYLEDMIDAMAKEGLNAYVCSAFRSQEKQQSLFDNKVNKLVNSGMSKEEAQVEAGVWVAIPGTSEHQLGLAADIIDTAYPYLDKDQENTKVQKWLMAHSWEYGFILRYPSDKSDITGIGYEPWHYRYVGLDAAKEIYDQGICLEEYLDAAQ